jgi:hypothetical protein
MIVCAAGDIHGAIDRLYDVVRGVRPQVCLFGHHHTRLDAEIDGVPCMGINKALTQAAWSLSTSVVAAAGCRSWLSGRRSPISQLD